MGDHGDNGDLTAAMALMQQQMQQTIQAQQAAAEQAALNAANQQNQQEEVVPIGQRNLLRNLPTTRSAINPPPCTREDFEIKPALISLVQRKIFNGLPAEIPMDHIEHFEKMCGFTKANGVPPDYIKCTLFPFSLDGKAAGWLDSLPTGSLTTWEQNRETDRTQKVNSIDNSKIDELSAKVDQLIKSNRIRSSSWKNPRDKTTAEATSTKRSVNHQAAQPAQIAPRDDMKSLALMMSQLLQGQQIQGKALNQVTNDINTRMNHLFNDLSAGTITPQVT
ncbi:hypothetical protein Bca4012_082926 [Brassica carinata]